MTRKFVDIYADLRVIRYTLASLDVAGQRIQVGICHAGDTVTVTAEGDCLQVHNDERILTEVARTTIKPIARYKARKPEPTRARTKTPREPTWRLRRVRLGPAQGTVRALKRGWNANAWT